MIKYKDIEFETVDQLIEYQEKVESLQKKPPRIKQRDMEEIIRRITDGINRRNIAPYIGTPLPGTPSFPGDITYGPGLISTTTLGVATNNTEATTDAVALDEEGMIPFSGFNMIPDENLEENQFMIRAEA